MDVCTIVASNYIAHARVLARSLLATTPGARLSVLVIDDWSGRIDPEREPFRVLSPTDIGCEVFKLMAARYTVLELSTAVKPWLLAHLLSEGAETITYLDPDIEVWASLEQLDRLAREHELVLTPHTLSPIPDDGKRPNQVDILIAGVHNLGYVTFGRGPQSDMLLDWWQKRLRYDCRVDPANGYFVDQRWFDLAPGLASKVWILRDPSYNVAYWNLHERPLTVGDDGMYLAAGRPLHFFHFSGFSGEEPSVLSKHENRVIVADHPVLERLCNDYAASLTEQGYDQCRHWSYTLDWLADGEPINRVLRELWRHAEDEGILTRHPFCDEGRRKFLDWLAEEPPGAPPGVNRAVAHIYGTRPDARTSFPDLTGEDLTRLLSWVATSDDADVQIPPRLRAEVRSPSSARVRLPAAPGEEIVSTRRAWSEPWGANVVGYFRSELGVGEAGRQVVGALQAVGVPLVPIHAHTIPPSRQGHAFTSQAPAAARFPVNVVCINADVLGEFAAHAGPAFFAGRHTIGMWFWEVSSFPDHWLGAFELVDEIWAPSSHIASALAPLSPVPIVRVPLPVFIPPVTDASLDHLGLPGGYRFLFSFDYHSVFERKNPLAVIDAFRSAFDEGDGASLVLKCINGEAYPAEHERLLEAATTHANIHVCAEYVTAAEKNALMGSCDCYVSLHRAEGFGLTMAEAMSLGRPVIATGYSGNLDFMTPQNSILIDHRLVPIGTDAGPYPADGVWAEPDVSAASDAMRAVFDDRALGQALGRRAAADIRRLHSPEATGEVMAASIRRGCRALDVMSPGAGELAEITEASRRLEAGPVGRSRSGLGSSAKLPRRVVLRTVRPASAHHDSVDREIIAAVETLARRLVHLERETQLQYAELTTEQAMRRQLERRTADLSMIQPEIIARLDAIDQETQAIRARLNAVEPLIGHLDAMHPEIIARMDAIDHETQAIRAETRALPYMEGQPYETVGIGDLGTVVGYRDSAVEPVGNYRAFEDIFRGSEDFIRDRQRAFLPILDGREPVLDLGCGRGEFLDVLRDAGLTYRGVDLDPGMVARCREKGHSDVDLADGVEYLEAQAPSSLGAIFCAQVLEHLPYPHVERLLRAALGALHKDGILVLETVNPHSPPALKAFWVDPTHRHPIFPEATLALCRGAGFPAAFFFHPNGTGDVEADRFTSGEYAVVAGPDSIYALACAGSRELRSEPDIAPDTPLSSNI
jgi:glycosyltransferase involved in cell wall biosynthesis/SAM-dependent methyltransferase